MNESLNAFFKELKNKGRWENTFIIVAGINGPTNFEDDPYRFLDDVTAHKTQVTLQFKPSVKFSGVFSDTYNSKISLTEVGRWIGQLFENKLDQDALEEFLSEENKLVRVRSDWGVWRLNHLMPVEGFRIGQYLFTFSPDLLVYDSYQNPEETEPLPRAEAHQLARQFKIVDRMQSMEFAECIQKTLLSGQLSGDSEEGCKRSAGISETEVMNIAFLLKWRWQFQGSDGDFAQTLLEISDDSKGKTSSVILGWLAKYFAKIGSWEQLLKISRYAKNPYWKIVALRNQGKDFEEKQKGCIKYFANGAEDLKNFYRHCEDASLRRIAEGLNILKSGQKVSRSFWHEVEEIKLKRRVKVVNLEMLLINDVKEALEFGPSLAELFFYLPENEKYRKLVNLDKS